MNLYRAEVLDARWLSPRMRRISVGGEGLRGFRAGVMADERFKLMLPRAGEDDVALPQVVDGAISMDAPRPPMRTLTVRSFEPSRQALVFDLAIHAGGLASDWAVQAQAGDPVGIAGPRGGFALAPSVRRLVMAGDHAALPAIASILEGL